MLGIDWAQTYLSMFLAAERRPSQPSLHLFRSRDRAPSLLLPCSAQLENYTAVAWRQATCELEVIEIWCEVDAMNFRLDILSHQTPNPPGNHVCRLSCSSSTQHRVYVVLLFLCLSAIIFAVSLVLFFSHYSVSFLYYTYIPTSRQTDRPTDLPTFTQSMHLFDYQTFWFLHLSIHQCTCLSRVWARMLVYMNGAFRPSSA